MTSAAAVFCCMIAVAFAQGFGVPAFAGVIASDAISATLPFLGILLIARFLARRMPARAVAVQRVHVSVQAMLAGMAFGWWWIEPHAVLTSLTGSSLAAMGWQAFAGALAGLVLAVQSERSANPTVLREVTLASAVAFLIAGGRIYRAYDHVEAGVRLGAGIGILAGFAAVGVAAYLLLRRREQIATAIPALAPAVACAALLVAWSSPGPAAPSSRESILLVVVDTLRADIADGAMKDAADAMPELARIAKEGVRYTQAVSPAPWTLPATVSLLSGWNPHRHRFGESVSAWEVTTGNPGALYFAGAMRDAGYLTSAFVHNPYLRPYFGFNDGFYTMRPYHGRAIDGIALALGWLSDHVGEASFTLLHLMDPHWPYDAPAGFGAERQPCASCDELLFAQFGLLTPDAQAELRRRYIAEVRYTDAMLGRFYDSMSQTGALDRTWLVITADHGEEFWEHGGLLHGHSLYDELLRVPLVVVPPRSHAGAKRAVRIDTQVRLEDVAATMLEIAGLDRSLAIDGKSLPGLSAGTGDTALRSSVGGFVKSPGDLSWSVRRPPWKAIFTSEMSGNRMFALDQDPGETDSLLFDAGLPEQRRSELSGLFLGLSLEPRRTGIDVSRTRRTGAGATPDADTHRNLRSLGYAD